MTIDLEMTPETHVPKKKAKPPLKVGAQHRVEVPYSRVRNLCPAGTTSKIMTLIDFKDGGVVIAQESCLVPANVKSSDPSYASKLVAGSVRWKHGTRLRRIKRSWIKEEVSG